MFSHPLQTIFKGLNLSLYFIRILFYSIFFCYNPASPAVKTKLNIWVSSCRSMFLYHLSTQTSNLVVTVIINHHHVPQSIDKDKNFRVNVAFSCKELLELS